jgi:hypothetical protein
MEIQGTAIEYPQPWAYLNGLILSIYRTTNGPPVPYLAPMTEETLQLETVVSERSVGMRK